MKLKGSKKSRQFLKSHINYKTSGSAPPLKNSGCAPVMTDFQSTHNPFPKIITKNLKNKQHSSQWTSPSFPCPEKSEQVRSNMKSIFIVPPSLYSQSVHYEFVSQGKPVNHHYYRHHTILFLWENVW
jgi:hypothetical protein